MTQRKTYRTDIAKGMFVEIVDLVRSGDTLVYLNMIGTRQILKSTWAALKGGGKRTYLRGDILILKAKEHHLFKAPLPCGWENWIMLNKMASIKTITPNHYFYLIDPTRQSRSTYRDDFQKQRELMPANFFPMLDASLSVPLLPKWASVLWKKGLDKNLVRSVNYNDCFNMGGWFVMGQSKAWSPVINELMNSGQITF